MNKNEEIVYVRGWTKKPLFLYGDTTIEAKDEKGRTVFVDGYYTIRPSGKQVHLPYVYPTRARAREFYHLLLNGIPRKSVYKAIFNVRSGKLIEILKKNP
jgi:hypothetical protein